MPRPQVEKAWGPVKKQSQRQLGAFQFLYLAVFKEPFVHLDTTLKKPQELRNDVVHYGKIPTRTEALTVARAVYEVVREVRAKLVSLDAELVERVELDLGLFRHHQNLDTRDLTKGRMPDGRFHSGSHRHILMLSWWLSGVADDFDSRLQQAEERLFLWGLGRPVPP